MNEGNTTCLEKYLLRDLYEKKKCRPLFSTNIETHHYEMLKIESNNMQDNCISSIYYNQ